MSGENRAAKRRQVLHGAKMARADGVALGSCRMLDISASGARLQVEEPKKLPDHFLLVLSHTGRLYRECAVVWRSEKFVGVEFLPGQVKVF
jgi:hypothetical protein